MFLSGKPTPANIARLKAMEDDVYRFAVNGSLLYYSYPKASAGKRRTIPMERILGVRGTARTWKVVEKLAELASA